MLQPIKTKTLEGIEVVEHSAYILTIFASADGRNGQVIKLTERNCYKKLRAFLAFAPKEKTVGDVEYGRNFLEWRVTVQVGHAPASSAQLL